MAMNAAIPDTDKARTQNPNATPANPGLELRMYAQRRANQLLLEREPCIADWREVSEYVDPMRGRFDGPGTNQARRAQSRKSVSRKKILNNAATIAVRTAAAGFSSHMTSKSRPWFQVEAPDSQLQDEYDVRVWTEGVTDEIRAVLAKSNFYKAMPAAYTEDLEFGIMAVLIPEDDEDVVTFNVLTAGTYAIALGDNDQPDTLYREFQRTARQLVQKYGRENLPVQVKNVLSTNVDQLFTVCSLIERNPDAKPGIGPLGLQVKRHRPWRELIWMDANDAPGSTHGCLTVEGYYEQPFACARFFPTADDTYSTSPVLDSLGDIKQLQYKEGQKAMLGDLLAEPPLGLPASLRNQPASLHPRTKTYLTDNQTGAKAEALYTPQWQAYTAVREDIAEIKQRIQEALFYPLFLMLASLDDRDRTATEVAERRDERAAVLGPTVESITDEFLDPMVVRVFKVLERRGRIAPAPPSLSDVPLKIEYTSILAQALKATGLASIERTIQFTAGLVQATGDPSLFDKVDVDQALDEYSTRAAAPSTMIRSDEAVAEIRAGRAQQQAMQQMAAMAKPMADAAGAYRTMAETVPQEGSAMDSLSAALGGPLAGGG